MTSVDKAAVAWSIAIVAVALGIVGAISQSDSSPAPVQQISPQETIEESMMMEEEEPVMVEEEESEEPESAVIVDNLVVKPTGPQIVTVSIPAGTAVPGCEETNECWNPPSVSINTGDTVVWTNDDTAAHTVTSGSPADGPDGIFDSSLIMAGSPYEVTFDSAGSFDYFCMVHPWMIGDVQVS